MSTLPALNAPASEQIQAGAAMCKDEILHEFPAVKWALHLERPDSDWEWAPTELSSAMAIHTQQILRKGEAYYSWGQELSHRFFFLEWGQRGAERETLGGGGLHTQWRGFPLRTRGPKFRLVWDEGQRWGLQFGALCPRGWKRCPPPPRCH